MEGAWEKTMKDYTELSGIKKENIVNYEENSGRYLNAIWIYGYRIRVRSLIKFAFFGESGGAVIL